jgi:hypothetical protein
VMPPMQPPARSLPPHLSHMALRDRREYMRAFMRQRRAAERAGRSASKHDRHIRKLEARIAQLEAENARLMAQLAAKIEPKRKAARRRAESENFPSGKKSNSSRLGLTEKTSPNRLMWESDDQSERFPHGADAGNGMRYSIREVGSIAPGSTLHQMNVVRSYHLYFGAYGARTGKLAFLGRFKTAGKAKKAAERHNASAGERSQPSARAGHRIGRPASGTRP